MCRLMFKSYSKKSEVRMLQLLDVLQLSISHFAYVQFPSPKSLKLCNFLFHTLNYIHQDAVGTNIHCQLFSESLLVKYSHLILKNLFEQSIIQLAKYVHIHASCLVQLFFCN